MKYLTILCTLLIADIAIAQKDFVTVNRAQVEQAVTDKTLDTYYPNLLQRFNAFDTTLSLEEYRLLYYGFVFQPKYSGYPDLELKEINAALQEKDYDAAITICDSILQQYPVCLEANSNMAIVLFYRDEESADFLKHRNRFFNLTDAVLSSGDGYTCETAFKTIFIDDEYNIIYSYFELESVMEQALVDNCDRMQVTHGDYWDEKYMYFDTSETINSLLKTFSTEKPKKKKKKEK